MTLENWASNRWLEKLESDREEIERLLANADGHLDDYQKAVASEMSADAQLSLAYDAIRVSATAALRATGYRVVRGGGENYRTIEALEFSIDPERKLIPRLDALRRKRNTGAYDDYGLVAQGEADLAGRTSGAGPERGRGLDPREPRRQDHIDGDCPQGAPKKTESTSSHSIMTRSQLPAGRWLAQMWADEWQGLRIHRFGCKRLRYAA